MVTSKPPEHPLLARPGRDMPVERRDKKITTDAHSVGSPDEEEHLTSRNTLPLGSVNVSVIVPCDRTSQHLPRIAEEKDSPTGSKEDSLAKEIPSSIDAPLLSEQEVLSAVKTVDSSLKKCKVESKASSQTQRGKSSDAKGTKILEEKAASSSKSDTKARRKESGESSSSKAEVKTSKPAIPEKDAKPKAVDQVTNSRGEGGKSTAQEKRELYRVGSSKD